MALFKVSNERAQFDAAGNDASDQYGAGIRFTQGGNARVTTGSATNYNQGIPMSSTGQVAIVDATAGLPAGTIFHNGLPISADKVCVSRNATAVVSNGLPFDSAGAVAADVNLDLNFIGTDALNSSVTFTRASTATFFNSSGVLTSAAINAPRFDYNPSTLAAQGLLIEEARTNLLLQSAAFNTTWVANNVTITADTTASPDGGTNGDGMLATVAGGYVSQTSQSFTAGSTITVSVFAKKNASNFLRIELGNLVSCWFNLNTGATASNNAGSGNVLFSAKSIQAISNGWYRCVLTVTTSTITTLLTSIYATDSDGNSSSINSNVFLWGAQLEAGAFATSYIPTTTTALTRSADVASVNALSPWYNSVSGTLYAEFAVSGFAPSGAFPATVNLSDNTSSNRININSTNTGANLYPFAEISAGGVTQAGFYGATGAAFGVGTVRKAAVAYALNDFAFTTQGLAVQTDTSGTVPTVDRLYLGLGPSGTVQWQNGWLRRVSYFPRRLANAELQSLTS